MLVTICVSSPFCSNSLLSLSLSVFFSNEFSSNWLCCNVYVCVDKLVKNTGRMIVYNNKMLYHLDELHPYHPSNLFSHAWMRWALRENCDFADRRQKNAIFFKSCMMFLSFFPTTLSLFLFFILVSTMSISLSESKSNRFSF